MNKTWYWKVGVAWLFTLGALLLVIPNFIKSESVTKFLPKTRFNLGLDLQGGTHLLLGIDLRRAILGEADNYTREIEELADREGLDVASVERDFDSTKIKISLSDKSEMEALEKLVQERFQVLSIVDSNPADSELLLDVTESRKSEVEQQTIAQALETLRNRLDEFGVAEPSIQAHGKDQIVIQLPGLSDPKRAEAVLGRTARLEFKIVKDGAVSDLELQTWVDEAKKQLPEKYKPEDLNRLLQDKLPAGTQVLMQENKDPTTGQVSSRPQLLSSRAELTGDMLDDARLGTDQYGRPAVDLRLDPHGTEVLDRVTAENINKKLAIILDDKVYSDPVIGSRISDGRPQITFGNLKSRQEILEEARDLSLVLRAGALPAPVEILESRSVGPSLGQDSIEKGKNAMMLGVALVMLFMLVVYRMSGIVANLIIVANVLFTLACLAGLNATITLPGIAGILISIGMAVDANVIIYERMREELRSGKSILSSIGLGFDRAHLTILDSNLTTMITAVILLQYGTGPIKGFAITLIFGLIANYFTAVWFTRMIFEWIAVRFKPARWSI